MEQIPTLLGKKGVKAKKDTFLAGFVRNNFNVAKTCRDVGINRTTFYKWCKNQKFKQRVEELMEERLDMIEDAILDNAITGKDTIAQIFLCKTLLKKRGYVEGEAVAVGEKPNAKAVELLASLIAGTENIRSVSLEFAKAGLPLPEPLSILLAKEPPDEEEDLTQGVTSEEELDRIYEENMAKTMAQPETFVPERKAEVDELKKELTAQDSFSEENMDNDAVVGKD